MSYLESSPDSQVSSPPVGEGLGATLGTKQSFDAKGIFDRMRGPDTSKGALPVDLEITGLDDDDDDAIVLVADSFDDKVQASQDKDLESVKGTKSDAKGKDGDPDGETMEKSVGETESGKTTKDSIPSNQNAQRGPDKNTSSGHQP